MSETRRPPTLSGEGAVDTKGRGPAANGKRGRVYPPGVSGFTFLEILAALFLMVLFLTPVLFLLQSSGRGITLNKDSLTAHAAANELVDQLLSIPYEDLPTGVFTDGQIADGRVAASAWPFRISPVGKLSRRLEITEGPPEQRLAAKKLVVTISWPMPGPKEGERSYTMRVLYAKETP